MGVIVGSGNERSNNRDTAEGLDGTQEVVSRGGLGIGGDQPRNLETQELLGGCGIGAKSGLVGALAVGLFQLGGGAGVGLDGDRSAGGGGQIIDETGRSETGLVLVAVNLVKDLEGGVDLFLGSGVAIASFNNLTSGGGAKFGEVLEFFGTAGIGAEAAKTEQGFGVTNRKHYRNRIRVKL